MYPWIASRSIPSPVRLLERPLVMAVLFWGFYNTECSSPNVMEAGHIKSSNPSSIRMLERYVTAQCHVGVRSKRGPNPSGRSAPREPHVTVLRRRVPQHCNTITGMNAQAGERIQLRIHLKPQATLAKLPAAGPGLPNRGSEGMFEAGRSHQVPKTALTTLRRRLTGILSKQALSAGLNRGAWKEPTSHEVDSWELAYVIQSRGWASPYTQTLACGDKELGPSYFRSFDHVKIV
ncbi:hypothetical protein F4780DRAFT_765471 [Xylariomycetidae sp. FL0641]|nr:hypothetical protein F4780DRAFT_765471 [Xylariomycetidae sp. FL0641]